MSLNRKEADGDTYKKGRSRAAQQLGDQGNRRKGGYQDLGFTGAVYFPYTKEPKEEPIQELVFDPQPQYPVLDAKGREGLVSMLTRQGFIQDSQGRWSRSRGYPTFTAHFITPQED